MKSLKILVTACGGGLGQGIIRCLRLMPESPFVYGVDCDPDSAVGLFADEASLVPKAANPRYADAILALCRSFEFDAVIPGSEQEIVALSKIMRDSNGTFPPLVCQDLSAFELMGDKFDCYRELENANIPLSPFSDGADNAATKELLQTHGFPIVVKPRRSSGSRSIFVCHDTQTLETACAEIDAPVAQVYIDDTHGEFSIGVYCGETFTSAIAFERELMPGDGISGRADNHIQDKEVVDYSIRVAQALNVCGSVNVQVRKGACGVRLLEINPRFSSLVAARAASGFRDLEWALREKLGQEVPRPGAFRVLRFQRFFHEAIDFGNGFKAMPEWAPNMLEKENSDKMS
ncbi:ATP-grasp domain-containing protein [Pseudodesulfovibrio sp.]|nr:ATP-grasp domain-containing protein [Pseudodesulfovibrio sp.]